MKRAFKALVINAFGRFIQPESRQPESSKYSTASVIKPYHKESCLLNETEAISIEENE